MKQFFIMKTRSEIPEESQQKSPGYIRQMDECAKKYKGIPILFMKISKTKEFFPVDSKKFTQSFWLREWLRKTNGQLELDFS